jgi:hypothetical protein
MAPQGGRRAGQRGVASQGLLRYLTASAQGLPTRPFLLGNGVMVTLRFLVPSF